MKRLLAVAALSFVGQPKYAPDFQHFDYVNAAAPKGGQVRLAGASATFDSLNPFIIKGTSAQGVLLTFETLMAQSEDEPLSEYGLVAESVDTAPDSVTFTLRPQARFNDGTPITAQDVAFTFDLLRRQGAPQYRFLYAAVDKAEVPGPRQVRFRLKAPGGNRKLPLDLGLLPVLSKAYWSSHVFDRTSTEPFLGSGPYVVESVDPGRSLTLRKADHWWGEKLPVNVGRFNFQRIRYDFYRDRDVALQAFKAGQYDFRDELSSKLWATGYDSPALRAGRIVKQEFRNDNPGMLQALIFNTRRPIFRDRRVRQALNYAFDFEWMNKNLFFNRYVRNDSMFFNPALSAHGPATTEERALLPPEVPSEPFHNPVTDGSGNIRGNIEKALALLAQAGWTVKGGRLVDQQGAPFRFEILSYDPALERILLPFVRDLERMGITATIRVVDDAQFQTRATNFDFDMMDGYWQQTLAPGEEQREFWGSEAAKVPGTQNYAGVHDPAVDRILAGLVASTSAETLSTYARALDRTLMWGAYIVPQYHGATCPVAYWNKFGHPAVSPPYPLINGVGNDFADGAFIEEWWIDPAKAGR